MTFGAEIWGPPLIAAGASYLSSRGSAPKETKNQKTQREFIDQLIASLNGQGPYADLYKHDAESFNKSFVEPAQAMFRNQIAPQIQQQYIASGQQGGTGMEDALARAGVDLNSMLNQYMYQDQQNAKNRQQNTIGNILGAGPGAENQTSTGQDVMSGLSGYLSSSGFSDNFANIFKNKNQNPQYQPRKGFEPA